MPKLNYARIIYLLCMDKSCIPFQLELALEQLALPIPQIHPDQLLKNYQTDKHKILLINYQEHFLIRQSLKALKITSPHFETILYNVDKRLHTEELLTFGNLKGLFYQHDSPESLSEGLGEIINGKNWLPRHISSQLLHYYRYHFQAHITQATVDLTAREIQILRCLQTGASNMQMAENLFISEFTVKSHLYQIFKKIAVKNRVQAISWANQNLLS
ncbi:LuxR C-terminal-related transcriptional regulator [Vibrio ziniensis]|uniref:DNA-binding response regulator n=1 Tax=Vibrio ziniensis TaxID=2711221 RepID=A0A6G7CL31_9VIBR|nr:LuxR C-terminal-related transcriptional regulator [Vibrio ziniensis]QIH42841.1 DNA-binding response regulator [Vibrio ziniensis]